MTTEAQKRATKSWKARRNLKRVELLLPEDILDRVDVAAAAVGISRTRFVVEATQQALGDDRLSVTICKHRGLSLQTSRFSAQIN